MAHLPRSPGASIDLALPGAGAIDRANPEWTTDLLDQYLNTINVFSKYDNVLAYNVGNEIITDPTAAGAVVSETGAAAFVKAAARDVRSYLYVFMFPPRRFSYSCTPTALL